MMKICRLKWVMPAVLALVMMSAAVPGTEAGRKWSGSDPILVIDGHQFNVRFEWPSEYDCNISGAMEVRVGVPSDVDAELITESASNHGGCVQETHTEIVVDEKLDRRNVVRFVGLIPSDEDFQVKMKVDMDGSWIRSYNGVTNHAITGPSVRLNGRNPGIDDPVNPDDELSYTYDDEETYHLFERGKRHEKIKAALKKLLKDYSDKDSRDDGDEREDREDRDDDDDQRKGRGYRGGDDDDDREDRRSRR